MKASTPNEIDEIQMIRNMLFNVHPNIDIDVLRRAYGQLPFKEIIKPVQKPGKIDLKITLNSFLEQQNQCLRNVLGIKSFAILLQEIEKIAETDGLLHKRRNRQLPGYLINISNL